MKIRVFYDLLYLIGEDTCKKLYHEVVTDKMSGFPYLADFERMTQ